MKIQGHSIRITNVGIPEDGKPDSTNTTSQYLEDLLTRLGLLSKDQLNIALKEQKQQGQSLTETLIRLGFLSEKTLNQVKTRYKGFSTIDLEKSRIDHTLIQKLPKAIALSKKILPIAIENQALLLAMLDAYDIRALDQAAKYFPGLTIKPVLVTSSALEKAIDRYYGYELAIDKLLKEIEEKATPSQTAEAWTSPIVRLVESLLMHGLKLQASDIHFQPEESYVRIRYRLNGILHQQCAFHKSYWSAICVRLKVLANLNLAESRHPQSGRFSLNHGLREIDFRVSSHPTIHGESIVLRILDKQSSLRSLEGLGFTAEQVQLLKNQIQKPQGLFIITGPTGSGKTTTMYSILNYLKSSEKNIMTLEQPVEYKVPLIRQSEIQEGSRTSFADGIRSLLRQDPDIIFVGEIRDEDTAQMAFRAAMTGHLVFTTLHTNDSLSIIPRLQDLGISPQLLSEYLITSVSQRLIRLSCKTCQAVGCQDCRHTGFTGRIAIGEVLEFSPALRQAISLDSNINHLRSIANQCGFLTLRCIAQHLVEQGKTTHHEIVSHLGELYEPSETETLQL